MKYKNTIPIYFFIGIQIIFTSCNPYKNLDYPEAFDLYFQKANYNGNVLVVEKGKPIFEKSYGDSDNEQKKKNTADTKFRIGSVTKPFTAMGIMTLEEEGKLNVNNKISDYLPELPPKWQEITVHQLLTHTSGLIHSWNHDKWRKSITQPKSLKENIELFFDAPLINEPGREFNYSGLGYFILAYLIEHVSEEPYETFMRKAIFDKAGMDNTGSDAPDLDQTNKAKGYKSISKGISADDIYMPNLTGGGNLQSTARDLMKFDRALTKNTLISEETKNKMFTVEKNEYAYGWFIESDTPKRISHRGGVPGFRASIHRYPRKELVIIMLSNEEEGNWGKKVNNFSELVLQKLNDKEKMKTKD